MRNIIAIPLFLFYSGSFMGYGIFTIVHDTLHQIPNIIHHHTHDHHHHHVEDHSKAFEKLKDIENNDSPVHSPLKIIFLLNYVTENGVWIFTNSGTDVSFSGYVQDISKTHKLVPPTPPPILS
ncbi:hypothetical protein LVD17_11340 [Fulvivirga ulvae]|uniref:hypothetical protein n=1 Tax=Fulvivirga ulvae TaxID=2904245 RepID=UPI001F1BC719|nr:hypothetical protein [Fulvivirga ulvae]UII34403.1 hypothetical protein LVD17_11340 [Fulvivirga ulvae]